MLRRVADGPTVIACRSCRITKDESDTQRSGARLAAALRAARAADPAYAGIAVEDMPCLFACGDACTVHLRAPGRIGYVLGRFLPDDEAARAILDYAVAHAASEHGQVPYKQWPQGVKGHFITRMPPAGYVVE